MSGMSSPWRMRGRASAGVGVQNRVRAARRGPCSRMASRCAWFARGAGLQTVRAQPLVEELLGARHVVFGQVFDDDGDVGVLLCQALQVQVVVERAQARRGQLDLADPTERMAFGRALVTDIAVLFRLVIARTLHVLGMRDADLVR